MGFVLICGEGVKEKQNGRKIKGIKWCREEIKKEKIKKERKLPCVFTNPLNLLLQFFPPELDPSIYNLV